MVRPQPPSALFTVTGLAEYSIRMEPAPLLVDWVRREISRCV